MAKATKKQALGRGLSVLLKDSADENPNKVQVLGSIAEVPISAIELNPFQPRTHFNEEALNELANSIRELGLVQPITIRRLNNGKFQLVSGERRFRASKKIGNTTIPAYIRTANDQEMLEMALVENIQRQNLDPIEIALSYQRLIEEVKLTQEALSERIGKKRSTVTNYLRLLKLDPIVQTGMRDGFLTMGHGRALININNTEDQLSVYEAILKNGLSVRQTEQLVKSLQENKPNQTKEKLDISAVFKTGEKEISQKIGYKVSVSINAQGKGKLVIPFQSEDDFKQLKEGLGIL